VLHLAIVPIAMLAVGQPQSKILSGPHDQLIPVPMTAVHLTDGFWADRVEINRTATLPATFHQCEITGRLANFRRAGGLEEGEHEGYFFNDSDVYKIIEGASYSLALHPEPELDSYLDDLIADIAAAQEGDGYLNTYYTLEEPDAKWTDIRVRHELYCAGHLFEAGVAHHEATGKRSLLDIAVKLADRIDHVFGPGKRHDPPGHQEIEIGLVKLYRATGEKRYLDLASFFLEQRGRPEGHELYAEYAQDHAPIAEQTEAVGHAVRAAYMYAGMAEVVSETNNESYKRALDALWEDVVGTKLYITGAIGASRAGEAFGPAYELPNESAYAEACAAIAQALWAQRMLMLEPDARYADVVERAVYNGFLVGISLSGDRFFYPNPLATDGVTPFNHGSAERSPWFACACCPSNDVRFIPRILSYLYANDREGNLYVNQFAASETEVAINGVKTRVIQRTDYPWDGRVEIELQPERPVDATLYVRAPGWAQGRPVPSDLYAYAGEDRPVVDARIVGEHKQESNERGYHRISGTWAPGDTVTITLPMEPRRVIANDNVEANEGRVAIERGPIVYCLEGIDNDDRALNLVLPDDASLTTETRPDLLGGVVTIKAEGARRVVDLDTKQARDEPATLTFVPFYAWNNRGANEMTVWVPRDPALIEIPPDPTIASLARVKISHAWSSDTPAAINDLKVPTHANDQTIPRHTWWDHRATTEWAELHFSEPAAITSTSLYWFDDTGGGSCRVPESWKLLYRANGAWTPVPNPKGLDVTKDAYDTVTFDQITTDALRIEVQLQDGYSGGILEWKVND
jgi:hypothetical protein